MANHLATIFALLGCGGGIGYLIGVQGTDSRIAQERTDHVEEIRRLQSANTATIAALTALVRTTATSTARAAAKVERAAEAASSAADTANNAARNTAPSVVNKSIKDANKQLKGKP